MHRWDRPSIAFSRRPASSDSWPGPAIPCKVRTRRRLRISTPSARIPGNSPSTVARCSMPRRRGGQEGERRGRAVRVRTSRPDERASGARQMEREAGEGRPGFVRFSKGSQAAAGRFWSERSGRPVLFCASVRSPEGASRALLVGRDQAPLAGTKTVSPRFLREGRLRK
jgi:hypothetical protein